MHQAIYQRLIEVARSEDPVVNYAAIAPLAGLSMDDPSDRNRLAAILDEINAHEVEGGRPLLSAVVVLAGSDRPGKGFFECARRLGRYTDGDGLAFWMRELKRVQAYWRAPQRLS